MCDSKQVPQISLTWLIYFVEVSIKIFYRHHCNDFTNYLLETILNLHLLGLSSFVLDYCSWNITVAGGIDFISVRDRAATSVLFQPLFIPRIDLSFNNTEFYEDATLKLLPPNQFGTTSVKLSSFWEKEVIFEKTNKQGQPDNYTVVAKVEIFNVNAPFIKLLLKNSNSLMSSDVITYCHFL